MKHITEVLVYKNRCEVFNQHTYTQGDVGIPHIKLIFKYLFEEQSLQGKQLECKYILPNGEYSVKTVSITEKDCVVFPIHYSVLQIAGWTTLKATLVCDSGRITLDDILIKTKSCKLGQLNTTPQVTQAIKYEIDEIKAFTETKKKEVTNHTTQEITRVTKATDLEITRVTKTTDSEIARVVSEGETQVQVLKNQSNGVLPRIEKLENGKFDKTGGSIKGSAYITTSAGDQLLLQTDGKNMARISSNNFDTFFKNETTGALIQFSNDGNTSITGNNLATQSKEVIGAINEINKYKLRKRKYLENQDLNDITEDGLYSAYRWAANSPINEKTVVDVKTYTRGFSVQKLYLAGNIEYNHREFARQKSYDTWSNWVEMWHTGNLNPEKLQTKEKEVVSAINELNSKKSDLTGSTFTGLVAVKKDTNGEAMVALNSAYGNGDIYSGGSAKGVGFKNRTSGKGLFLTDSGKLFLEGENIDGPRKDVVECLNLNIGSFKGAAKTLEEINTPGVYTVEINTPDTPYNTWGTIINMYEHGKNGINKQLWLSTGMSGYLAEKTGTNQWIKYWSEANFDPSTKLDKSSVVNDLTTGGIDKVLSAEQGKRLSDEKLDKSSVVNDVVSGGDDKPLSAEQGKLLKQEIEALKQQIAQLKK